MLAGTFTKPERPSNPNLWDFLGACYLERWNFDIAATSHIDGGIPCLSGRTSAIRTSITQDQKFIDDFGGEKWLGRINLLAADDDNFITRFLVNHGWKIAIQGAPEAALTTTLESDSRFLGQCIRWYRTTWRSNFTSLFIDRVIWRYVTSNHNAEDLADCVLANNHGRHTHSISRALTLQL